MKKLFIFAAFFFLTLSANAGWKDDKGKDIPDTKSMKSKGLFGAQVFLAMDDKEPFEEWKKEQTASKNHSRKIIKKGQHVYLMFAFTGTTPNNRKESDVTATVQVVSPDGSIYADIPSVEIYRNRPIVAEQITGFGISSVDFLIEPKDLPGNYIVKAVVSDNVSNTKLAVETDFMVVK